MAASHGPREGGSCEAGHERGSDGVLLGQLFRPRIIITYWGSGVPEVAQGAAADGMDTEGTVYAERRLMDRRSGRNLHSTPSLTPIRGVSSVLLKEQGGIDGHELVPMFLCEISEALTHGMGGASEPPGEGMIKAMAVSGHTDDRPRVCGLPKRRYDPCGLGTKTQRRGICRGH